VFDDIFDANFRGAYFTVQKALPILSNGGAVVFTTSWFDEAGIAGTSAVSASKAALRNFTRTLASELIGRNIRVNAVSPGVIETPLFGKLGLPEANAHELAQALLQQSPQMAARPFPHHGAPKRCPAATPSVTPTRKANHESTGDHICRCRSCLRIDCSPLLVSVDHC
jgi:NAD(P)-dependent dehydrogenase (short-subunit alcohol dehydrogenase family)